MLETGLRPVYVHQENLLASRKLYNKLLSRRTKKTTKKKQKQKKKKKKKKKKKNKHKKCSSEDISIFGSRTLTDRSNVASTVNQFNLITAKFVKLTLGH